MVLKAFQQKSFKATSANLVKEKLIPMVAAPFFYLNFDNIRKVCKVLLQDKSFLSTILLAFLLIGVSDVSPPNAYLCCASWHVIVKQLSKNPLKVKKINFDGFLGYSLLFFRLLPHGFRWMVLHKFDLSRWDGRIPLSPLWQLQLQREK